MEPSYVIRKFLDAHDIPHVIVVNKIEDSNDRMRDIMHALQDVSDRPVALRQVPIRRIATRAHKTATLASSFMPDSPVFCSTPRCTSARSARR